MTDQLEWEEFVRNDPAGEFYSLLKSCAKAIHRNISIWKEALANEGIVLESYLSMDWENTEYEYDFESAIEELANIIYTFLGNELVKRPHFAACYNEGNISLLMASIIKRFKMLLLDQQRARNTYQAYYRRCRESLSDSEMVQCQNVYSNNDNRGLAEGMRYAPASEQDIPAPDRILLDPEEYRMIPPPSHLEQKDIRKSSHIVPAALYFWNEVARREGKCFVLIKEFVEYMRCYYNIFYGNGPLNPSQMMQWPSNDRGGFSLEESVDDDKSELHNLEKEFLEYLEKTLEPKDLEVYNALRSGQAKNGIIQTISGTEHYYKKSRKNIDAALRNYDSRYYEAFRRMIRKIDPA